LDIPRLTRKTGRKKKKTQHFESEKIVRDAEGEDEREGEDGPGSLLDFERYQ
jgi:hypothetical protein